MEKDIYTLLNEVSTDTSSYPEEELTEAQLQKFRTNIKKKVGKKRHGVVYSVLAAAACAAFVAAVMYLKPIEERMRASGVTGTNTLSAMLGVNQKLEEYVLYPDETKRIKDGAVTLNAVAVDEGRLVVYTTQIFEGEEKVPQYSEGSWGRNYNSLFETTDCYTSVIKEQEDSYRYDWEVVEGGALVQKLFVNGEEFICDVTADYRAIEDGVIQDIAKYHFPANSLEFPAEIRIELYKDAENAEPETFFEFELTEEMVIPNIKEVDVNKTLRLPDGKEVKVTRFVYNALGMWIYVEYDQDRANWMYKEIFLDGKKKEGYASAYFREIPISQTESVMIARETGSYNTIPLIDSLEFKVSVWYWREKEEKSEWITLEEELVIPLKSANGDGYE